MPNTAPCRQARFCHCRLPRHDRGRAFKPSRRSGPTSSSWAGQSRRDPGPWRRAASGPPRSSSRHSAQRFWQRWNKREADACRDWARPGHQLSHRLPPLRARNMMAPTSFSTSPADPILRTTSRRCGAAAGSSSSPLAGPDGRARYRAGHDERADRAGSTCAPACGGKGAALVEVRPMSGTYRDRAFRPVIDPSGRWTSRRRAPPYGGEPAHRQACSQGRWIAARLPISPRLSGEATKP